MRSQALRSFAAALSLLGFSVVTAWAADAPGAARAPGAPATVRAPVAKKPKYAEGTTRLARDPRYLRESPAPDYWALSPYYVSQSTDSACSAAVVSAVVNAARASRDLRADEELATQDGVLARAKDAAWRAAVRPGGPGVGLARLKELMEKSLRAYGVERFKTRVVWIEVDDDATRARVRAELSRNERSARDFVVANFSQAAFTGDADVGHYAPVGAFDEAKDRVLALDPDRRWYEPYWVSLEAFVRGMAAKDPETRRSRGYLVVELED